jgi:L-ascorbate metabolism protein UlaG (beta-lactamase superfamily)
MKIFWHGKTCFEIADTNSEKEPISIIIDPIDDKFPKKDTDILLLTHPCEYNKKEKPFTINALGEYEVREVFIQGIPADESIIFALKINGIKICHLGINKEKGIGRVDILFIDGGEEDYTKIIKQLEPSIVVPMNYDSPETFLKRMGAKELQSEDVLKIQKKHFEVMEQTEIVVLNKK